MTTNRIEHQPSPNHKYTLDEVAEYCGRTPQLLRLYYSEGILPEPRDSKRHKNRTIRKFTLAEANHIKSLFGDAKSVKRGAFTQMRKRAERRAEENGTRSSEN